MSVGIQVALCVVVVVVCLAVILWIGSMPDTRREIKELRQATDELGRALGEALRPPFERLVRELARIGRGHDELD